MVENATIIGLTQNNAEPAQIAGTKGIILPRTSKIHLNGVNFHNFPAGTTALKTCSKCDTIKFFTNTVKEYFVEGITMNDVQGNKLEFTGYHKVDVIYNTDGSLSSYFNSVSKPSATLVYNFPHIQPEANCVPATTST